MTSDAASARGTTAASRSGPVGVGVVGTGMISDTYLEHLTRFPDVRVVIAGNRTPEKARAAAERHGLAA